jgi:CheY-like chemotaxis protein
MGLAAQSLWSNPATARSTRAAPFDAAGAVESLEAGLAAWNLRWLLLTFRVGTLTIGFEVLRAIRSDRRTKLLILTSSREQQDIVESYGLGANSYVRKPVDFEQFQQAILNLGLYWLIINEDPNRAIRS